MAKERRTRIASIPNQDEIAERYKVNVEGVFTFKRTGLRSIAFRTTAAIASTLKKYKANGQCELCKNAVCEVCKRTLHYLRKPVFDHQRESKTRHYCPDCKKDCWKDVKGHCIWFDEPLTTEFRENVKAIPCQYGFKSKYGHAKKLSVTV